MVSTYTPSTLNLTEGAVKKILSLSENEKQKKINLRVYVTGGGCSGFQYGFTLDKQKDDDWVFETNGTKLLIDPMSGIYFKDATIDYVSDPLKGSQFVISNPNAKSTCGCGSSAAF